MAVAVMRRLAMVLAAVALLLAGPALAAETPPGESVPLPPGTLSASELFDLFNDRTVYSVTAVKGRESVSYYDPGGEVRQLQEGIKRTGRWRITPSGRICLQMEDLPEKCRIVVNEGGTYRKYIVRKNGQHQSSVSYPAFREGNPLGL